MPPKQQPKGSQASKKTQEKKKEKVIEDKTFGLKNKKGKKQQEYIKHVTQQVKYGNQSMAKVAQAEMLSKKEKEEQKKEKSEMTALFRPVAATQKTSAGADPKSVLCAFYKQGLCKKGDKCKFSHDLSLEAKSEKRSMYVDIRDEEDAHGDTMESWDEDHLRSVVARKHGKEGQSKPKTDKVCKHFLYAIEKGVYGWFWECPSGGDKCIYRHALPPGFVLKRDKEEEQVQETATITLEELVEREREELISSGKKLTPVTLQSFLQWKKRKLKEKREKAEEAKGQRRAAFKQGKLLGISGRELFEFNPDAIQDDDEAAEGTGGLAAAEVDSSDSESGEELAQDLTNLAFELEAEGEDNSYGAGDGVEVDEDLFVAEALDPLNRALLARLAAGDLMLDQEEEEEEEEEWVEGEVVLNVDANS